MRDGAWRGTPADPEEPILEALGFLANEAELFGLADLAARIDAARATAAPATAAEPIDPGALRAVVLVAETGGFTAAAGRLGLSQAAISFKIGKLEDRLGVRLFDRGQRGARLTPAGVRLLPFARMALALDAALRAAFAGAETGDPGRDGPRRDAA